MFAHHKSFVALVDVLNKKIFMTNEHWMYPHVQGCEKTVSIATNFCWISEWIYHLNFSFLLKMTS